MEHAGTFLERAKAVRAAVYLGMPMDEIEAYLDWLDTVKSGKAAEPPSSEADDSGVPPVEPDETARPG